MISAGCGASALLALCVVVALAATVANAALGRTGSSGAGAQGNLPSGGVIAGLPQFPTNTVPPWTPGQLPNPIVAPTSATSPPLQNTPTPTATATATGDATPTPTSGALPTTCNGQAVGANWTATWAFDKCPELPGQGGSLTVTVPGWANAPISIIVSFGTCVNGAQCTVQFTPDTHHLNGQSTITVNFTVPAVVANNAAPISGQVVVSNGGPSFSYQAAPVQ